MPRQSRDGARWLPTSRGAGEGHRERHDDPYRHKHGGALDQRRPIGESRAQAIDARPRLASAWIDPSPGRLGAACENVVRVDHELLAVERPVVGVCLELCCGLAPGGVGETPRQAQLVGDRVRRRVDAVGSMRLQRGSWWRQRRGERARRAVRQPTLAPAVRSRLRIVLEDRRREACRWSGRFVFRRCSGRGDVERDEPVSRQLAACRRLLRDDSSHQLGRASERPIQTRPQSGPPDRLRGLPRRFADVLADELASGGTTPPDSLGRLRRCCARTAHTVNDREARETANDFRLTPGATYPVSTLEPMPALASRRRLRPGLDRPQTQYAWPPPLLNSKGDKPLVYLDMNHWIFLAQAATGHANGGRYQQALDALRQAAGRVVIPLASVHYMEIEGNRDARQRSDLARLMEELSGFACVLPRSSIAQVELDAALAQLLGTPSRFSNAPLLGWGVMQALGLRGGLTVHSEDEGDVTARVRQEWPGGPAGFDAWSHDGDLQLTRAVLRGPTGEDVADDMRARGWNPTVARQIAEERAKSERELAQRLVAEPEYRDRVRDVVSARYLAFELVDVLKEAVDARGLELAELVGDIDAARRFTDSMPSGDAWISLLAAAHRNPQSRWQPNDIFDFDALSVAIPYCDVVVTDRHACRLANAARLPSRLGTKVIATLDELVPVLDGLL